MPVPRGGSTARKPVLRGYGRRECNARGSQRPHQAKVELDAVHAGVVLDAFQARVGQVQVAGAAEEVDVLVALVREADPGAGDEVEARSALRDIGAGLDGAE